jgi:serine/threonine-protein kinase
MPDPQATEVPVREGDLIAGKYRVERVLGMGGMGVVVAAMHAELDQRVAVKMLLPAHAQNPAVVARFSREARAAAKIKSEHVVRVSDVGSTEVGLPYIVMEYLEGHDLAQALERSGTLPFGTAVDFVLQACEALAEAHAAGFVHRDLKPGNLFLARRPDGSELVKVLDFGISKAAIADEGPGSGKPSSLTQTSDVFGSPLYMSPEQLKSARDVDARADIWAIGIILYELCAGVTPFDRATVAETFGAILYERPEPLRKRAPQVPMELESAILRCLEKDAARRFQNVAELAKALFPFAENVARGSVERTARVLKRAGVPVDSVPPPGGAPAATNLSPQSATRTAWDTQPVKPKRASRAPVIAGLVLGLAVGGGLLATRVVKRAPTQAAAQPSVDPARTAAARTADAQSAVAPAKPTPAVTPSAIPSATLSAEPVASASAAPTVVPGVTAAPFHGKPWPAKTSAPTATAAPAPTTTPALPAPAPPPPPPPSEDPNGFGDRK